MKLIRNLRSRPTAPVRSVHPAAEAADVEQAMAFLAQRHAWEHLLGDLRDARGAATAHRQEAPMPYELARSEAA